MKVFKGCISYAGYATTSYWLSSEHMIYFAAYKVDKPVDKSGGQIMDNSETIGYLPVYFPLYNLNANDH